MELDDKVYEKITALSEEGDGCMEEGKYTAALDKFHEALLLVPDPRYDWEASTWLYAALGDASYADEQYKDGIHYFMEALKCPDGLENPFILLRLGECFYQENDMEQAKEYLLKAYMLEGKEIFEEEPEYLRVIEEYVDKSKSI